MTRKATHTESSLTGTVSTGATESALLHHQLSLRRFHCPLIHRLPDILIWNLSHYCSYLASTAAAYRLLCLHAACHGRLNNWHPTILEYRFHTQCHLWFLHRQRREWCGALYGICPHHQHSSFGGNGFTSVVESQILVYDTADGGWKLSLS